MARLSVELQRFFFEQEPIERDQPRLDPDKPDQIELDPPEDTVQFEDILALAGERIFGFLFVMLSLPSALPVPAPGYSIPFGVIMLVLAVQLIIGRARPWIPKSWQKKSIKLSTAQKFIKAGLPWLQRIEAISRPRLTYVCISLPGRIVIGSAIALMSMSMMVPIPGTNTLPAIGIFVTGFGLLDDDGAISLGGLTLCSLGLLLTGSIVLFGYAAVKGAIEAFKVLLLGS